tara:strand:+ start:187 stop:1200 length:1014 start_codon:yes stop_codon:yes gene_type:complete
MSKINNTTDYASVTPVDGDLLIGTDVSNTATDANGETVTFLMSAVKTYVLTGAGTALELYAENPSTPTAPSATGTNSLAIGDEAVSAGTNTIALQRSYASGEESFAAAIANNSASYGATGANSVALGPRAKAPGGQGIAMGFSAWAYGARSFAVSNNAQATGTDSIAIGRSTKATETASVALGFAAASLISGKLAYTGKSLGLIGSAQTGTFVLMSNTTDATATALTTTNSAAGTTNQIILPDNSAYAFHGTIIARQQASAGTACAAWKVEGLIRREGSAGTTVLVNSATTILDNTPAWGMALTADTTNGGLKIEVTGAAATNIRWVATINTSEVTY